MDPITLRAIERLLAVLIGGLSIYLGYHLFLRIPHRTEGEGKIAFPNGISVHLARVGPGIFFALFGAAVVGLSLFRPISYETIARQAGVAAVEPQVATHRPLSEQRTSYSGFGQTVPRNDDLDRLALKDQLSFLNRLPQTRRSDLDLAVRRELEARPAEIKLRLMLDRWSPAWGDKDSFQDWVESGAFDPAPDGLEDAAVLFRSGIEARS